MYKREAKCQCVVVPLNHKVFRHISSSIFVALGSSGAIKPYFDKNKALVDIKIGVSLQARLKLQLSAVSSFMDS